MKRTIVLLCMAVGIAAVTAGSLYYALKYTGKAIADPPERMITPTPAPEDSAIKIVKHGTSQYAYAFFVVSDPTSLSLIPNFSRPEDAESLVAKAGCISAINGGFYDKANRPLGYFATNGTMYGPQIKSDLVNGFLWAQASSSAVISTNLPNADYRFALQTGPILMFDGNVLPLSINNDSTARRMVAARSMDNRMVFVAIFNENSVYDGPLLTDVPAIIQAVSEKENLHIADAINLDGGSASAFYSGNTRLSELTPVGSIFCVQKHN